MRILREDCAAAVVDIQEKLFAFMHEKEDLQKRTVKLIEGLKVLNVPMLITDQYARRRAFYGV